MSDPIADTNPPSLGERLRIAREAKGLALDEVASQTRIPIRHLQHIEREEWDALPAVTYCVGFVRAYANAIGLDGAEYGRELRDRLGGTRTRAPAAEYYEPADPARVPPRSLAIIAGVMLVVLILGYAIWRSTLDDEPTPDATIAVAPQAPRAAPKAAAPQPVPAESLAGQPVVLAATGEAWVRIEDQAGGTLFQGILSPGQRFQVPAAAQRPVIRTGRPQMVQVLVGNRNFGPIDPVERTVSNFSLRPEDLAARQAGAAPAGPAPVPAPITPQ